MYCTGNKGGRAYFLFSECVSPASSGHFAFLFKNTKGTFHPLSHFICSHLSIPGRGADLEADRFHREECRLAISFDRHLHAKDLLPLLKDAYAPPPPFFAQSKETVSLLCWWCDFRMKFELPFGSSWLWVFFFILICLQKSGKGGSCAFKDILDHAVFCTGSLF